jgi:hypothetical protein
MDARWREGRLDQPAHLGRPPVSHITYQVRIGGGDSEDLAETVRISASLPFSRGATLFRLSQPSHLELKFASLYYPAPPCCGERGDGECDRAPDSAFGADF